MAILLGAQFFGMATAAEPPKRKAGLWEMRSQMEGMPVMGSVQICVGGNDNLLQQRPTEKPDCSVMDVKQQAGGVTIHAVCRVEGSTVTTDGTFTGNFESSYRGNLSMRYDPPMHGMKQMRMTQEAKLLGPCAPGQKPGDVVMPNAGNMDMEQMKKMMNDPRMQEMMKQHQQ